VITFSLSGVRTALAEKGKCTEVSHLSVCSGPENSRVVCDGDTALTKVHLVDVTEVAPRVKA